MNSSFTSSTRNTVSSSKLTNHFRTPVWSRSTATGSSQYPFCKASTRRFCGAEVMKVETPGRTNLTEYRQLTGNRMPRIVAIIDEFHEVFEEDDRTGHAAFAAFSNIVRQGPFAGVHLVLAS